MNATTTANDSLSVWPTVLARLARERSLQVEDLRGRQLLHEAAEAWPGPPEKRWSKWLGEAGAGIGLRCREVRLALDEAFDLCRDGALLVTHSGEEALILTGDRAGNVSVATYDGRDVDRAKYAQPPAKRTKQSQLEARLDGGAEPRDWIVVERPELRGVTKPTGSHAPVKRVLSLLRPERGDIWVVTIFAFFVGVLSLATPIAIEALVDTVAFGRLLQPVVMLALVLFAFLAFAGAMRAFQTVVVELLQRRLFARVSADLAYRLPRVRADQYDGQHAPELVNRFFDVVTVQKVSAQLLLDGIGIVLTTAIGMAVLGFYHPWLLGFDIILLVTVVIGLYAFGRGAISTAVAESKFKYKLAAWLEDVSRCPNGFKLGGASAFAIDRANHLAAGYLQRRQSHFGHLFRQLVFILALQAIAATVLLGFGGWLVISDRLTLGQLVAAELIVMMILGSIAKFGKHLEGFFDLTASVDKLGVLFDLEEERQDGMLDLRMDEPLAVRLDSVKFPSRQLAAALNAEVDSGECVALYGNAGSGKSTVLELIYGLRAPASGRVEVGGLDPGAVRPDVLRTAVAMIGPNELFAGTIAENVAMHRSSVCVGDVRAALDTVGLLDPVLQLPNGIDTPLTPLGGPLSATQASLVVLARALAGHPRLLLIDGLLDRLGDDDLERVFAALLGQPREMTVLVATGRRDVADRLDRALQLRGPSGPGNPPSPGNPSSGTRLRP